MHEETATLIGVHMKKINEKACFTPKWENSVLEASDPHTDVINCLLLHFELDEFLWYNK